MSVLLCSICLEHSSTKDTASLKCGHVFHIVCIQEWLKFYSLCPKCKCESTFSSLIPLFIDEIPSDSKREPTQSDSCTSVQPDVNSSDTVLSFKLEQALNSNKFLSEQNMLLMKQAEDLNRKSELDSNKLTLFEKKNALLQGEIKIFKDQLIDCNMYMEEIKKLESQLKKLTYFKNLLTDSDTSVNRLLDGMNSDGYELLVTSFVGLKKEYQILKKKHSRECQNVIDELLAKENDYRFKIYSLEKKLSQQQQQLKINTLVQQKTANLTCDINSSLQEITQTAIGTNSTSNLEDGSTVNILTNSLDSIISPTNSNANFTHNIKAFNKENKQHYFNDGNLSQEFGSLTNSVKIFKNIIQTKSDETSDKNIDKKAILQQLRLKKSTSIINRYKYAK